MSQTVFELQFQVPNGTVVVVYTSKKQNNFKTMIASTVRKELLLALIVLVVSCAICAEGFVRDLAQGRPITTKHVDVSSSDSYERISRRQWIAAVTTATKATITGVYFTLILPATAATEAIVDPVEMKEAFDKVRRELSTGGVAYLEERVKDADFNALLEFTKTYDQVLRKGVLAKAKRFLVEKQDRELATVTANAVTFDLIGINRSSRPGQESQSQAAKYVQELRDDLNKFLDLEPLTIQF